MAGPLEYLAILDHLVFTSKGGPSILQAMSLNHEIKRLRLAKGWSMEKLADEVTKAEGRLDRPLSWQMVQQWEKEGGPAPNRKRLPVVAALLGVPLHEIMIAADFDVIKDPPIKNGMAPILAWEHETDLPPGEFVMVPKLGVRLSAGGGVDQVEIELAPQTPQAFRAEWIRGKGLKPRLLAAMTASGDSMDPTICDGDSLLVNTGEAEVTDGKVYALWYDGGERVKRLFRLPGGGLRIKSDNPEYGPIELGADYHGIVRIIGRVIHRSGTGGL